MADYYGIYGKGYKDNKESLYLDIADLDGVLVREKTNRDTYDVGVINGTKEFSHISLLENISLRQWREFFCKSKRDIKKIDYFVNFIMPGRIYDEC